MNNFGSNFRISIFGESHGSAVGVVVDGMSAGVPVTEAIFEDMLARRRGGSLGATPRREIDTPRFLSGLYNGMTTGAPLTVVFENQNVRSSDYPDFTSHPRPSHADFVASVRFAGYNDVRGGGHFSGRLTLPIVAAGVLARQQLAHLLGTVPARPAIVANCHVTHIGGLTVDCNTIFEQSASLSATSASALADPKIVALLTETAQRGDSLGGIVQCTISGVPIGVGEPFFDSLESILAHLVFSIPGVRGIEFGAGFAAAAMLGSRHNDTIVSRDGSTTTNNAAGIVGGLSNGNDIVFNVAFKPTASIAIPQSTLNLQSNAMEMLTITGRHDVCIALRGAVVVEAVAYIALANLIRTATYSTSHTSTTV